MRLVVHWLINAAALFLLPYVLSSIQVKDFVTALVVALVLGLVNAIIRPVLVLLTLPVTILTLGFFILVINALLFWAVASFVDGFQVAGFWSAFFGAIIYALVSWAIAALLLPGSVSVRPREAPRYPVDPGRFAPRP
jgi:putative membrane protein